MTNSNLTPKDKFFLQIVDILCDKIQKQSVADNVSPEELAERVLEELKSELGDAIKAAIARGNRSGN